MAAKVIERTKVDEQGNIQGLLGHKGEEVYIVKAPRLGDGKSLEKPREFADEIFRFVKQHRELAEKQYREFTERHGDPAAKVREFASHLTPEEFSKRTKELAEYAERRLGEVRKEVEAKYARLEKEIEQRAETILKGTRNERPDADVTLDERAAAGSVENRAEREF